MVSPTGTWGTGSTKGADTPPTDIGLWLPLTTFPDALRRGSVGVVLPAGSRSQLVKVEDGHAHHRTGYPQCR
jgi:hypothetical protein